MNIKHAFLLLTVVSLVSCSERGDYNLTTRQMADSFIQPPVSSVL